MSSAKRMISSVAMNGALNPHTGSYKVPSHLRKKTGGGRSAHFAEQTGVYRRERSNSGDYTRKTYDDGSPEYRAAFTDRAHSAIGQLRGDYSPMVQKSAKVHLAGVAKQVSGSNYHAYKIDETADQITCYLFQKRKGSRGQGPTNPMGISGYSPAKMASHYRQSFRKVGTQTRKGVTAEAFNLEKQHKIINPHRMQLRTCNRDEFKEFKVIPNPARKEHVLPDKVPFPSASTYKADFPDWKAMPHHIEKHPQYPVYSLPFKGETEYQGRLAKSSQITGPSSSVQKYSERTQSTKFHGGGATDGAIKGALYAPVRFQHQTTQQMNYKPFKIDATQRRQSREDVIARVSQAQSQKNEAQILTRQGANPYHFKTMKGQDYKKLRYVMVTLDEDESVPSTPLLRTKYIS